MEITDVKIVKLPKEDKTSLETYKQKLRIEIFELNEELMEFDLIGMYPGLINAFRRILLAEVPSMAIEKVFIYTNTSLVQDEILSHRLGLIPLKADPRLFQNRFKEREGTDRDTVLFEMKIACQKNNHARYGHKRVQDLFINSEVYSSSIKWIPIGEQEKLYKESEMGPIHKDILIAKLKPGLEIDLRMEAIKGIGQDHAKFSPVATASFRLLSEIKLLEDIKDEEALALQSCFSPGVIGIKTKRGEKIAFVQNQRLDFCSRNIFYNENLKNKVKIGLVNGYYIFTIESSISTKPSDLFKEAVKILKDKCTDAQRLIKELCMKKKKKKKA